VSAAARFDTADLGWMAAAIAAGRRGLGHTAPNPAVGSVVVRGGRLLGSGWHRRAGLPHAEREALAGVASARGATVYVTLEPCSHFGRTAPCADALIEAGVERVVVGLVDPNPAVAGRGIRKLRRAGIRVDVGCLREDCRDLVRGYLHRMHTGMPWVHLKLAASLDGRIATSSGASRWISSSASRRQVHALRARSDAILVGIGTVLADDPRLTARVRGAADPLRVVLDPRLRTPVDARVVSGRGRLLLVAGAAAPRSRQACLEAAGAEVLRLETRGRRGWQALLRRLARRGVGELLIEGGAGIAASAVRARIVDRLTVYYNPRLIGGDGVPMLESLDVVDPRRGPRLRAVSVAECGGDLVWSGDFQ
jgi:diaminohydroxyphosphoribosylaminopyrimidine deaminase/5-amino-6-(5-phosphoribosylamino)uracil reductase